MLWKTLQTFLQLQNPRNGQAVGHGMKANSLKHRKSPASAGRFSEFRVIILSHQSKIQEEKKLLLETPRNTKRKVAPIKCKTSSHILMQVIIDSMLMHHSPALPTKRPLTWTRTWPPYHELVNYTLLSKKPSTLGCERNFFIILPSACQQGSSQTRKGPKKIEFFFWLLDKQDEIRYHHQHVHVNLYNLGRVS